MIAYIGLSIVGMGLGYVVGKKMAENKNKVDSEIWKKRLINSIIKEKGKCHLRDLKEKEVEIKKDKAVKVKKKKVKDKKEEKLKKKEEKKLSKDL